MDTALLFSGGKDSLACLYLYRDVWDRLPVIWVNTGAAYPEMIEYMEGWKRRRPHFIEVKTKRTARFGNPEDQVDSRKLRHMIDAGTIYIALEPVWRWIRYDILAIKLYKGLPPEYLLIEDVYL